MADPFNILMIDRVRAALGRDININPVIAGEVEISNAIDLYYKYELSIDGILNEIETGEIDFKSLNEASEEYSQPVVRLVDSILSDAIRRGASDVHFDPEANFLRIRYRIDGVLRQVRSLHKSYYPAMTVRLKVMSSMNIAEQRAPQDGRFTLQIGGRPVDFRVSCHPTNQGENFVLRILDRNKSIFNMEDLGLTQESLSLLKLMIARPEGIILVTGPTGSGKTTTLYSIMKKVNDVGVNIMTLEDPVEYPIPMIRQTSVGDAIKLDFANGIRSMMRQDPDIILVGEIRDKDTAEMAFRAAMTGHQVFSTLHTNSATGAIPRLLDLGILPDIMAGNLIGIIAQRLLRRLCPHCKRRHTPTELEKLILGRSVDRPDMELYEAVGCEACSHTGYRGRFAVMELMKIDSDLDDLIARRSTAKEIRQVALDKGFRPLAEVGMDRVRDGLTSLDELSRVVDLTERIA